ncbi:hypothetical protein Tco_0453932 [Tanacetum coccineum]
MITDSLDQQVSTRIAKLAIPHLWRACASFTKDLVQNPIRVRSWFHWISFDYRVTLGFGSITSGLDPVNPVIRLPIEHGISSGTRVGTMAGVDINTLTMEQYLALSRENQAPDVVKPEIGGNVNFEIKSQFMRELREDAFFENKNEDAHDHVDRVLNILKDGWIDGTLAATVILMDLLQFRINSNMDATEETKGKCSFYPSGCQICKDLTLTKNVLSMRKSNHWKRSSVENLGAPLLSTEVMKPRFRIGASVNLMHRNIFEYLRLANLRNTNMLVEMADMTKGPLEISFDYRVTLGFGSITGGLDHVNLVIRLPIEHGISSGTRVVFHMAQQVILAAQLIPRYHTIGRCNNYVMLQSIPCSPDCKIAGQILLDHPLSFMLYSTADVLFVYLPHLW